MDDDDDDDYDRMEVEDEDEDEDADYCHGSSSTGAAPRIKDDLVRVPRQKPKNKNTTKRRNGDNINSSSRSSTTTTTKNNKKKKAGNPSSSTNGMVRSKRNNVRRIDYSDDKKDSEQEQEEEEDFQMKDDENDDENENDDDENDNSGAKEGRRAPPASERTRRRDKQRGGGSKRAVNGNAIATARRRTSAATAAAAGTAANTNTARRLSSSSDSAAAAAAAAAAVVASGKRGRKRKKRLYEEEDASSAADDDDDTAFASYSVDDTAVTKKKKKKKVGRKQNQIPPRPSSTSTSTTPPSRSSSSSVIVFKEKTGPSSGPKNHVTRPPTTRTMTNETDYGLSKTSYRSKPNSDDVGVGINDDNDDDVIKEWGGLVLPTEEELMVEIAKLVPTPGTTYERKREEVLVVLDRFCDWVWTGRPTNDRQQFLLRFQELAGIQRVIFLLKRNTSWMECVIKVTRFLAWCFVSDIVQPAAAPGAAATTSPRPTTATESSGGSISGSGSASSVSKNLANMFIMKNGIHILLLAAEDGKRCNYDSRLSARALSNIWVCMTNVLQSSTNVKDYMRKGVIDVALDILDDLGSRSVSSTPEIPVIMQSIISTLGRVMSTLSSKDALECEHQRDVLATVSVTFKSLQAEWTTKKDTVLSFVDFLSRPEVVRVTRTETLELYVPLVIAIVERYSIEPGIFQRSFSLIEIAFAVLDKETLAVLNVAELLKRLQFAENDPMKSKVDELLKQLS